MFSVVKVKLVSVVWASAKKRTLLVVMPLIRTERLWASCDVSMWSSSSTCQDARMIPWWYCNFRFLCCSLPLLFYSSLLWNMEKVQLWHDTGYQSLSACSLAYLQESNIHERQDLGSLEGKRYGVFGCTPRTVNKNSVIYPLVNISFHFTSYSCLLSIYTTYSSVTSSLTLYQGQSLLTDWTSHPWLVGLIFNPAVWASESEVSMAISVTTRQYWIVI